MADFSASAHPWWIVLYQRPAKVVWNDQVQDGPPISETMRIQAPSMVLAEAFVYQRHGFTARVFSIAKEVYAAVL